MANKQNQDARIGLFSRLLLWQKFAILGMLAFIMAIFPFGFYFNETEQSINKAELEAAGARPAEALLKVVQLTQRHRGLSSRFLSGDKESVPERLANEKELAAAVAAMDTVIRQEVADDKIAAQWAAATRKWQGIEQQVADQKIDRPQSIKLHTALINEYLEVLDKVSDHFGMSLDPEPGTYFLIRSTLYGIPLFTEALGKLRAEGSGMLVAKQASPEDRFRVAALIDAADFNFRARVLHDIEKTFAARPDIKAKLDALLQTATKQYEEALELSKKEVVEAPAVLTYPRDQYFDLYTLVIDGQFELNKQALDVLGDALNARVARLRNTQLAVSSGILGLFALGVFVAFTITRSVTRPVGHLVGVMDRLSKGDTAVRASLETFDEIGLLGRQFDMMVDQREAVSAKIQQENEQLNNSVIELMQAVAKLADKNLTIKVPVAEDITGLVADALNMLTDETAKVLNRVVDIAGNVAQVSRRVKTQSDTVIGVAAEEKREVELAASELNLASEVMQDIAKLALSCNQAAEQAIHNTDKAQETVLGTVEGITTIRDTIRETEKRIKRLGERSQEIGGVVTIINGIAERTHILAVNASMHAASAGEAGRGFAVVANEVQKLAENAREATSKISALVNNIQLETADTVTTMNDAISQVVRGTSLAQQAGSEMRETRDTTASLVQLVRRIADSSKAQAQTSLQLRERALQIQKSTEDTFVQLQEQGAQTDRLVGYSEDLVESVGVFTLPKAKAA